MVWVNDPITKRNVWVGSSKPDYKQPPSKLAFTSGTSSSRRRPSTPTYTSALLGQTFTSQSALQQAELNYQVEQQRQIEQARKAEQERIRIETLKKAMVSQGARTSTITSIDSITKAPLQITRVSGTTDKFGRTNPTVITEVRNLNTGEVIITERGTRRGGGSVVDKSRVTFYQQSAKEFQTIQQNLTSAGLKPVIVNNQVIAFADPQTGKTYKYNEDGVNEFNKDVGSLKRIAQAFSSEGKPTIGDKVMVGAMKGDEKIGSGVKSIKNYVSNKLKNKGINIKDKAVVQFISKTATNYKNKGIETINEVQRLAQIERDKSSKRIFSLSRNLDLKKPSNLPQAVLWTKNFGKYIGDRAVLTAVDLGIATPQLIKQLLSSPLITIVSLPPAIIEGFKQDIQTVKSGDVIGIVDLAIDYFTYVGTYKLASSAIKRTSRGLQQLLPSTKRLVDGKIVVRKTRKLTGKKELVLTSQTAKSSAKPLPKQVALAGQTVTAVTAQANQLFGLIKSKVIIRKPIPGEANFPAQIKRLLAKFDAGKMTNKEFTLVNSWLRKNVAPNYTLLERSLYLDPASGLRISRLGLTPDRTAGIRDILRGNFRLWNRNKPQIIVFENAQIAKFPKSLSSIKKKLQTGKPLTEVELNKLIKWQVKTGDGKFKPIGSTIYQGGRELEITLAPGEMIKRVKRLGRIFIDGKKVTIVSAEVYKPSLKIVRQLRLAHLGKLGKQQLQNLEKFLSKELGRKIKVETPELSKTFARKTARMARRADPNVPVLRLSGVGIRVLSRGIRRTIQSVRRPTIARGRITRGISRGRPVRRSVTRPGRPTITRRTLGRPRPSRPGRPIRRTTTPRRPPARPGRRPPKKPTLPKPPIRIGNFQPRTLSKPVETYYVVEKVRGKFKKLYPKPLIATDARDYATYSIDNRLSRTAFFIPLGKSKKVVSPPKEIQGYFQRNSQKFRPYKIRFGKKRQMVNGYIEKRKFTFDKPGERRKSTLRNLAKARAVRNRNIIRKRGR